MAVGKGRLVSIVVVVLVLLAGLVPTLYYTLRCRRLAGNVAGDADFAALRKAAEAYMEDRQPQEALPIFAELLRHCDTEKEPLRFASIKRMQGRAYQDLGQRPEETRTALPLAISAYGEALKAYERGGSAMGRAAVQESLGATYRSLAEVEEPEANLAKARTAYARALDVYTREDFPIQYAVVQNSLGVLYESAAEHGDEKQNLTKAAHAYSEAVEVLTELGSRTAASPAGVGEPGSNSGGLMMYLDRAKASLTAIQETMRQRGW